MLDKIAETVLPQIPKKWLSHNIGLLAHKQPPKWINQKLIHSFAKFYGINLDEVELPLENYKSLGEFFVRKLKTETRPIAGDIVHPCDGRIIQAGTVHDQTLIQSKGKSYQLDDLIPKHPWNKEFEQGFFATYYLSPKDYHRVHSPVSGKVSWLSMVPGELWPVNAWSVANVDQLYAINERVAIGIETEKGPVVVVLVGATNVGSISLSFGKRYRLNSQTLVEPRQYDDLSDEIQVGQELGCFHLGSSAILLMNSKFEWPVPKLGRTQMGGILA